MLNRFSRVWFCVTLWTAAWQAPLSIEFSRQGYWRGLLCPPPGDLPEPGIKLESLMSNLFWQVGSLPLAPPAAKSLESCSTLCDPIDGSPPGSPVPGIVQARILEWVAISFSNAWKWKVKGKSLSCVRIFTTPRTAAYQAPPSMGFSRQEYWSGLPLPSLTSVLEKLNWRKSYSGFRNRREDL